MTQCDMRFCCIRTKQCSEIVAFFNRQQGTDTDYNTDIVGVRVVFGGVHSEQLTSGHVDFSRDGRVLLSQGVFFGVVGLLFIILLGSLEDVFVILSSNEVDCGLSSIVSAVIV